MMDSFISQMRNRRKLKRLSLRKLSNAIDNLVSHEMIARFEKGTARPRKHVQEKICEVLGIVLTKSQYKARLELADIQYRKRSGLPVKEHDSILAEAVEHFNLYLEIEHATGEQLTFSRPLNTKKEYSDMEAAAMELRRKWHLGMGPLPNLSYLIETKGIKISEVQTDNTLFDGFTTMYKKTPLLCLASWLNDNLPRKRMTLAHELGHIVLPNHKLDKPDEAEGDIAYFAGAFLLPEESLKEAMGEGVRDVIRIGELVELKKYFGVSIKAIMVRAYQCGLISDKGFERFNDYYKEHNFIETEPGCYTHPEQSLRYARLVTKAFYEGSITSEDAEKHFHVPHDKEMEINII